jgi:hypothetical protein
MLAQPQKGHHLAPDYCHNFSEVKKLGHMKRVRRKKGFYKKEDEISPFDGIYVYV